MLDIAKITSKKIFEQVPENKMAFEPSKIILHPHVNI